MTTEPRFSGKTTKERSRNMSRIRGKDTSIEVKLRRALWANKIRYRKQYRLDFLGRRTVDIAVTKYKIAIFCDSEFFHGKDWPALSEKLARGKNPDYWTAKISRNIERDLETDRLLTQHGWTVLRFWQKDIDNDIDGCVETVKDAIRESRFGSSPYEPFFADEEDQTGSCAIAEAGALYETDPSDPPC